MTQGHEIPQPDPRIAEAEQRLFGHEFFKKGSVDARIMIAGLTVSNITHSLAFPHGDKRDIELRLIDARVAQRILGECIDAYANEKIRQPRAPRR